MSDFGFDPQLSGREMKKIKYYEQIFAKLDSREIKRQNSYEKPKTATRSKNWYDITYSKSASDSLLSSNNDNEPNDKLDPLLHEEQNNPLLTQTIPIDYDDNNWNYSFKPNQSTSSENNSLYEFDEKSGKENINKKRENSFKEKIYAETTISEGVKSEESPNNYSYNKFEAPHKIQKTSDFKGENDKLDELLHEETTFTPTALVTDHSMQLEDLPKNSPSAISIDKTPQHIKEEDTKDTPDNFTLKKCDTLINICPKLNVTIPKVELEKARKSSKQHDFVFETNLDPRFIFSVSYAFRLNSDPRKLLFSNNLLDRLTSRNNNTSKN